MKTPTVTQTFTGMARRAGPVFMALVLGMFLAIGAVCAGGETSSGATVYVPVYSHIYVGIRGITFDLAISLSIRNTDAKESITVQSVAYYGSDGKLVKEFLQKPVQIGPLSSKDFFVSEADTTGGFGASFLVRWTASTNVNEPIIEGVMAGTKSGQGISFTSRGQVIRDRAR